MARPTKTPMDPTALAKFGGLEVVAKMLVEGYMIGQHKSPFKGSSVEFVEHRQYYPGDEIKHIDWRAFGKTGHYYIKEYEEETNLRSYLIVDSSGSMAYHGATISKFDYARQLAAALAYLLLAQRDACGLITFDTKIADRWEPSTNRQTFQQIVNLLEARRPGKETELSTVFSQILPTIKRRSLIFLISDCFDRIEPLAAALKLFRSARHEVVLFQVVAPEEEEFTFKHPTQFRNLERAGHNILADPYRLRKQYLDKYRQFTDELTRQCGNAGVDYLKLRTDEPYDKGLGAFLDRRLRRKGRG
ncbi:MAG: DUF58 domain-containing protein [Planctomycetes bacterium]|nr:DUF58 domain-containing protein [Planctomycetota bacterium]